MNRNEQIIAIEQLIETADKMIDPEASFSNRKYVEADEVIQRARTALAYLKREVNS